MADIIDSDLKELLTAGSYLMYEFKDVEVLAEDDNGIISDADGTTYSKSISPLFSKEVVNSENNQGLLDVMAYEIPYYYREPNLNNISLDANIIPTSRDSGINDVPNALQNEFWSVWFRDSLGYIQNSLLLSIYNQIRFPFMNENQYLNASLFPELAQKAFSSDSSDTSLIEFKYTEEDNAADIANGDNGCVDYLEDIIAQKLSSMYKILDYNPEQFVLLSDWGESLYKSGRITEAEVDREKTIFKLQDLKHELLRRKFAGSATLYTLAISSIDRQGSFIGVIPAGRLNNVFTLFRDKRYLRVVNIPGILSKFANLEDNKPLKTFYEVPYADDENYIPVGTCEPLFYTSSNQAGSSLGTWIYNPENFYLDGAIQVNLTGDMADIGKDSYRNIFLRDNANRLDWESLTGIISSESINDFYPKLDEIYDGEFRTLDSDYIDSFGQASPMRLDIITPFFSLASIVGNFLDISANHLLYHRNTIQENLGDNYDYLTYPIAGDNGVCLMDIPWMDYLNNSTSKKSRIQDQSYFGAQLNTYANFSDPQLYEYSFFCLSFAGEDLKEVDLQPFAGGADPFKDFYSYNDYKEHYEEMGWTEEPKYAYIWYFTVEANILEFPIMNISGRVISKILLNINEKNYSDIIEDHYGGDFERFKEDFSAIDDFETLISGVNVGPLPLTYNELATYRMENAGVKNETSMGVDTEMIYNRILPISLGITTNDDETLSYNNTFADLGYTTSFFVFSNSDLNVSAPVVFKKLDEDGEYEGMSPYRLNSFFTKDPSSETKLVYFGLERQEELELSIPIYETTTDSSGNPVRVFKEYQNKTVTGPSYYWSHPIRVISIDRETICNLENKILTPDWYRLCFHLNPYLNFTQESASAIRRKKVIPSFEATSLSEESLAALRGPSQFAGLVNLTRTRGYDFCCNDEGTLDAYAEGGEYFDKPYGMYLDRLRPGLEVSNRCREYMSIYGDNRFDDVYNRITVTLYDDIKSENRSDIFYDEKEIACIRTERGDYNSSPVIGLEEISLNQFLIAPCQASLANEDIYNNWYWNESSNGVAFFINLKPVDIRLLGTAKVYRNADTDGVLSAPIIIEDSVELDADEVIIQRKSNYDKGITTTFAPESEFSLKLIHEKKEMENGTVIESRFRYEYYLFGTSTNTTLVVEETEPIGGAIPVDASLYSTYGASSNWGIGEENATDSTIIYNYKNPEITGNNRRIAVSTLLSEDTMRSSDSEITETWPVNSITISMAINEKMYQKEYVVAINPTGEGFIVGESSVINPDTIADIMEGNLGEGIEVVNFKPGQEFDYPDDSSFIHRGEGFIPGAPMKKYKINGENKPLKYIELLSEYNEVEKSQKGMFLGNIYDLRLHNVGFTSDILAFYNQGLMRELYSYAPSTYKLAYSVYRDYGIFKPIKGIPITAGRIADIKTIRLFDRSVWDSVLTDMYPISTDEMSATAPQFDESYKDPLGDRDVYDEDGSLVAIEQDLVEDAEVTNNISTTNNINGDFLSVTYRGRTIKIDGHRDLVSVINASIYPVEYKNHLFESEIELSATAADGGLKLLSSIDSATGAVDYIEIPARQVGDTLRYNAKLSLNFEVEPEADLSVYYSRGTNIAIKWHDELNCSVVERTDENVSGTTNNHIMIPLTLPRQENVPDSVQGTIDRFYIRDFQFNSNILTFLRASNYYKEVRIPIAVLPNLSGTPYFVYKWDAIRLLREGSYFFTVKYPIQIIPFMDDDFNSKNNTNFPMLYLAARFKVQVKGNPIPYDSSKYELKGIPAEYTKNNISATISGGNSIYTPDDNRTFPHREMDIDLFVMDGCDITGDRNENYSVGVMGDDEEYYAFRWKKIASNHETEIKDEYCDTTATPKLAYKKNEEGEYEYDDEGNLIPLYETEDGSTTEDPELALKDENGDPVQAYEKDEFGNIIYEVNGYVPRPLIYLDSERLDSGISMTEEIPMFMVKNFQSPFFISKYNKGTDSYDHTSADDDTIFPIRILPLYNENNLEKETLGLSVTREADLDSIYLVAGKTYYIIFDYEARVSEMSFIDEVFSDAGNTYDDESGIYKSYLIADGSDEKKHYARMVNLMDSSTGLDTDYMYNKAAQWSGLQTVPITARTSGFRTSNADGNDHGWAPINIASSSDVNTFGNPYSRASSKNYLLSVYPEYRGALENLCYFPYVIEDEIEVNGTTSRIWPAKYFTELDVVTKTNNVYTRSTITFDENRILKSLFDSARNIIKTSINSLSRNQSPTSGFFDYLSKIRPRIHYEELENVDPAYTSVINAENFYFYGYQSDGREIPSRNNNIKITRNGVYSNNLLKSKDFDNANYWYLNYAGEYVSDDSWDDGVGKDVYRFDYDEPITLRYTPKNAEVIETQYEVALNIAVANENNGDLINGTTDNVKVYAQFLLNGVEVDSRIELTDINRSQNKGDIMPMSIIPDETTVWYTFSKELENAVKADSVEFQIECNENGNVFVTKPVIRSFGSITEILGMYDALNNRSNASSNLQIVGHKVIMFVDKETNQPIPVQFLNTKGSYANSSTTLSVGSYAQTSSDKVSTFFSAYNLGPISQDNKKTYKLIRPWERRVYYWYKKKVTQDGVEVVLDNKVIFRKPRKATDSLGVTKEQIEKVDLTRDNIFSCPNEEGYGISYDEYTNGLRIDGILLKTDSNGKLLDFNTNLVVYKEDPLEFMDERFSLLSNCFNPTAFLNGEPSPVAVTNIQLISPIDESNSREIIYEFEYLPVIYDESRQHISFNILLHKSQCVNG